MGYKKLSISNNTAISAIYFALLHCGYDFYSIGHDASTVNKLRSFIVPNRGKYGFFSEVRQNTCEVYPYWPRAAMLETATFYIDLPRACFVDFDAYKGKILSAENISDIERNETFWNWILRFPTALKDVFHSDCFSRYLEWENTWIEDQNKRYQANLKRIEDILVPCKERFHSPFQDLKIVLNPIKCAYSADYHVKDETFIFCSGTLSEESVIHEFLHHAVHPVVENRKDEILRCSLVNLDLDASYYLNGNEAGKLNAFEEYMVRKLTDKILSGDVPENLGVFFDCEIRNLRTHPLV